MPELKRYLQSHSGEKTRLQSAVHKFHQDVAVREYIRLLRRLQVSSNRSEATTVSVLPVD